MIARRILILAGILLFQTGCLQQQDWIYYRGLNGAGYTPNALHPPLGRRWQLLLQKRRRTAVHFNPPIVSGDTIYFGSSDNNFYAFDIDTGYQIWSYKTRAPVNSIPFVDSERVYFGSNDGFVYALNRENGEKIWDFNTGRTVQSLVLRYKGMIIFTSDQGRTFFLDLDGNLQHSVANPYWKNHTFQVYDDILYWVPQGINFAAYDVVQKRYLPWVEDVRRSRRGFYGVWYSFPALDEDGVYYGRSFYSRRGIPFLSFKARTRREGRDLWEREDNFRPGRRMSINKNNVFERYIHRLDYMAPSLWQNTVIFTAGDTLVRAFNRKSGKTEWTQSFDYPVSSAPTVGGDRVYFGLHGDEDYRGRQLKNGRKPRLVCISARDGGFLWDLETDGIVLSAPVISGNRLMFGTSNYLFYILEEVF